MQMSVWNIEFPTHRSRLDSTPASTLLRKRTHTHTILTHAYLYRFDSTQLPHRFPAWDLQSWIQAKPLRGLGPILEVSKLYDANNLKLPSTLPSPWLHSGVVPASRMAFGSQTLGKWRHAAIIGWGSGDQERIGLHLHLLCLLILSTVHSTLPDFNMEPQHGQILNMIFQI